MVLIRKKPHMFIETKFIMLVASNEYNYYL